MYTAQEAKNILKKRYPKYTVVSIYEIPMKFVMAVKEGSKILLDNLYSVDKKTGEVDAFSTTDPLLRIAKKLPL